MPTEIEKLIGLKVLIIDDVETQVELIKQAILAKIPSANCYAQKDFAQAVGDIASLAPEVIILDLLKGAVKLANQDGEMVWKNLWEKHFVPVIIYSADESFNLTPSAPTDHPFVKCVAKGAENAITKLCESLDSFAQHILALRAIKTECTDTLNKVLRESASLIWKTQNDPNIRSCILTRSARRRLAASMDMGTPCATELFSWEIYIYPPLETGLLMGDILKEKSADKTLATSYRVILTPSCDLQNNKGDNILIAKCEPPAKYLEAVKVAVEMNDKHKERLDTALTQPQTAGYVLLPEYPTILPLLTVNLRAVELIKNIDIGPDTSNRFERVASIDSPFRESLAWAFIQIAARPGVPNRDIKQWIEDIAKAVQPRRP